MGTRSLTVFYDDHDGGEICVVYRQLDGYPEGHGKDLLGILEDMEIVNGFSPVMRAGSHANGMRCLTAQVIQRLKGESGIGGIYVHPAKTRGCGEEYVYHVRNDNGKPSVTYDEIYEGKNNIKLL